MPASIQHLLNDLWKGRFGDSVDATLQVYEELNSIITKEHINLLRSFLDQDDIGFWMRELITATLLEIGGSEYIPLGLEMLHQNSLEGHDSDSLEQSLVGVAEEDKSSSKALLEHVLNGSSSHLHEDAQWLLEYC
ncbi:hypothetical protein [Rubritalea tangerina]|uniref:Uncharacterized protein n=1 Tax=Rubritalea tangerina TaxID=430798 RepID=A0ABW4ZEC4_9BACT